MSIPRENSATWTMAVAAALWAGACGSDDGPRGIPGSTGSSTSSGPGGGALAPDPLQEDAQTYVLQGNGDCDVGDLWPGCTHGPGDPCDDAKMCLPQCCSCPDGGTFAAGACDIAAGETEGVCASKGSICSDPDLIAAACP